jgi:hypothetical protein
MQLHTLIGCASPKPAALVHFPISQTVYLQSQFVIKASGRIRDRLNAASLLFFFVRQERDYHSAIRSNVNL